MIQPLTEEKHYSLTPGSEGLIETQTLEVSIGPQHPSTHGVFRMDCVLDGETVVALKPVMGYLHRNHEQLAERMAAMQSLLRSLSPDQRAELQGMLDAVLRDDRLRWDLARLAGTLDQLLPGGLGDRMRFWGDESMGLEAALGRIGDLQAMDALETQLEEASTPGELAKIDPAELCLLYTSPSPRDLSTSRMPSSA